MRNRSNPIHALIARLNIAAIAMGAAIGAFSTPAHEALAATADARFKAGETSILNLLESASEQLDMQIDASAADLGPASKVTLPDWGPLAPTRAKEAVLTALRLGSYTWIHDPKLDLYRVMKLRDARDFEVPVIEFPDPPGDSDLLVTYVLPLKHAPPEPVARTLRSFAPASSRLIPDDATQSLLITDSARSMIKYQKLAASLDTPEAAEAEREYLEARAKKAQEACPPEAGDVAGPPQPLLIAIFALIALVIGFLSRGYVIRRIEGGL
jgi:hypothetical protein